MRDGMSGPALLRGGAYQFGHFMYENSRIVRNQVKALNIRIYSWSLGWSPQMKKALRELEREASALANDPEALSEYTEAIDRWKLTSNSSL